MLVREKNPVCLRIDVAYDQEGNVRVERFQEARWSDLVQLWASYNRFLAHLLAGVPEGKRVAPCYIGENPVMTMEQIAADYLRHMQHHLDQIEQGECPQ